ncbi:MAG: hypothetical protein HZB75_02865 [Candidatus Saccharibacteria bacterium]|nr:MAG: hypothetical protein HZB75_02865 [Candidatus Saccharibacteria bacterium]
MHHDKDPFRHYEGHENEIYVGAPGDLDNQVRGFIERFDFHDHPDLYEASLAIIDGLMNDDPDADRLKLAWQEFAQIAEGIVEATEVTADNPDAYTKAQIEAMLYKALLFQTAGKTERYLEELDRAEVYALNNRYDGLSVAIDREIATWPETVAVSPEMIVVMLRGRIADENREFLRDLAEQGADLEDMIGHAYSALLEEGEDPESVLAELGILQG